MLNGKTFKQWCRAGNFVGDWRPPRDFPCSIDSQRAKINHPWNAAPNVNIPQIFKDAERELAQHAELRSWFPMHPEQIAAVLHGVTKCDCGACKTSDPNLHARWCSCSSA